MAAGLLFPPEMQERVIRLVAGTWFLGTQALIDLLCKQPPSGLGVPSDPKALHGFLLPHKTESSNKKRIMLGNTCLYDDESQLLFPKTGETDIRSLDITLLGTVIFNCTSCHKSSSVNFDVNNFAPTQGSIKGDYVFFMKELRNVLAHWGLKSIDQCMFNKYWEALEIILKGLGFDVSDEDRDLFQSGPVTQEGKFCKGMVLYRLGLLHDSIQDLEKRVHASESKISEIDDELSELAIKLADSSLLVAQLDHFTEESTGRLLKDINALGCDLKAVLLIAQEAKVTAERAEALAEDAGATAKRAENTANEANVEARSAELKADEALSKACAVEMTIKETLAQSAFPQERKNEAFNELKQSYEKFLNARELNQLGEADFDGKTKAELRVSLLVVEAARADRERFNRSLDVLHHMSKEVLFGQSFELDNLLEGVDVAVIRGIPGIGKSTLCQTILSLWIDKKIWVNKYDLVFYVNCSELIMYMQDGECNTERALEKLYPRVFKILPFNDMGKYDMKSLIIADSIDEVDIDQICSQRGSSNLAPWERTVLDIITTRTCDKIFIGRPAACYQLQQAFLLDRPFQSIEVVGFSEVQAREYVHKFFMPDNQKAERIWNKMRENPSLFQMVLVPVFNSILCSLFKQEQITSMPETQTELYVRSYLSLVFRHHKDKSLAVSDILQNDEFLTRLRAVCKMAYGNLFSGKIVFPASTNTSEKLLVSPFILQRENYCLFSHLTLMEFFASVEALLRRDKVVALLDQPRFRGSLPMYCGLVGASLKNSNSPPIIIDFMKPLLAKFKVEIPEKQLRIRALTLKKLSSLGDFLYFAMCYEFRNPNRCEGLRQDYMHHVRHLFGEHHHYQMEHLIYFLKNCLKDGTIIDFMFGPADKILTDSECIKIVDGVTTTKASGSRFKLHCLSFNGVCLSNSNMEILSPLLIHTKYVSLSRNDQLSIGSWEKFTDCIRRGHANESLLINSLFLESCNIEDGSMQLLSSVLPFISLVSLSSNPRVSSEGWRVFSNHIQQAREEHSLKLTRLILMSCEIADDSMAHLSPVLPFMSVVDLSGNDKISAKGWRGFSLDIAIANGGKSLEINCLRVRDCKLSDESMEHLSAIVPLISDVNLSMNSLVPSESWRNLSRCIAVAHGNGSLRLNKLDLTMCYINDETIEDLCPVIPLLSKIDISQTPITRKGFEKVVFSIQEAYKRDALKLTRFCAAYSTHRRWLRDELKPFGVDV